MGPYLPNRPHVSVNTTKIWTHPLPSISVSAVVIGVGVGVVVIVAVVVAVVIGVGVGVGVAVVVIVGVVVGEHSNIVFNIIYTICKILVYLNLRKWIYGKQ